MKLRVFLLALCCLALSGCYTEDAKIADGKIMDLNQYEVTLNTYDQIREIDALIAELSKSEQKSLKAMDTYEEVKARYAALEDEAVLTLETQIAELPSGAEVRFADRAVIEAVEDAFDDAPQQVTDRVSNTAHLDEAVDKLEKVLEDAWEKCTNCGGDGRTACSKCGGSGSRKMPYQTPNGKWWSLWAECATTQSCTVCKGRGGMYVDPDLQVEEQVQEEGAETETVITGEVVFG